MYTANEKKILLQIARDAIEYGLSYNKEMILNDLVDLPEGLLKKRASFVTLNIGKNLRGCIGSLEAYQPLIKDVAHNAFAAAFRDPRFSSLTQDELECVNIHISVLSIPESITFNSEDDLLRQLKPGVDGLILTDGANKGTFLPAVWESLADKTEFFTHLKMKAGLPPDYWSDSLVVERYTTESFADD